MAQELPRSVKAIRILLFVVAALTFVVAAALFIAGGASAYAFGYALALSLPGVVQLGLGLLVPKGGGGVFYAILVTEILLVLVTLAAIVGGGRPSDRTRLSRGHPGAVEPPFRAQLFLRPLTAGVSGPCLVPGAGYTVTESHSFIHPHPYVRRWCG